MAEGSDKYLVRDSQGNVYGPANVATMREWIGQGRIVAGMHIAPRDTDDWMEVSTHPGLADLLAGPQTRERPAPAPFEVRPVTSPRPVTPVSVPVRPASTPVTPYTPVTPVSVQRPMDYAMPAQQNVPALISMIAGIVAAIGLPVGCVPVCGCVGIPVVGLFSLTAIILGSIGLYQIKSEPGRYEGRGRAIAGLSLGIGVIILYAMLMLMVFVFQVAGRP